MRKARQCFKNFIVKLLPNLKSCFWCIRRNAGGILDDHSQVIRQETSKGHLRFFRYSSSASGSSRRLSRTHNQPEPPQLSHWAVPLVPEPAQSRHSTQSVVRKELPLIP